MCHRGRMKLFRREPSADDSLVMVATQRGWREVAAAAMSMLPPSHEIGDPHDLGSSRPPGCGGRAFAATLPSGAAAQVSHVEIYRNETDEEIYDVVRWRLPSNNPWGSARFEVLAGADLWGHHRLSGRFGHPGSRKVAAGAGKMRIARAVDDATVAALVADPDLALLFELGAQLRNGFVAELVDGQAAVFSWLALPHRGTERWELLVAAAEAFDRLLGRSPSQR